MGKHDSDPEGRWPSSESSRRGSGPTRVVLIAGAPSTRLTDADVTTLSADQERPPAAGPGAAVFLWPHGDGSAQRQPPPGARRLAHGQPGRTPIEAGVTYWVEPDTALWFEGNLALVAPLDPASSPALERALRSLTDTWGERGLALLAAPLPSSRERAGQGALLESRVLRPPRLDGAGWHGADVVPDTRAEQRDAGLPRLFLPGGSSDAAARACRVAIEGAAERGRVRVWVPACATGETTYAIAMLLLEAASLTRVPPKVLLFGTDLDEEALAAARAGRYRAGLVPGTDAALRERYLFDEDETTRVAGLLREVCVFSRHDLMRDPPMARMDLLVCHRVLDRVPAARRAELIAAFHRALREGGLLLPLDRPEQFTGEYFESLPQGYLRARARRRLPVARSAAAVFTAAAPSVHRDRRRLTMAEPAGLAPFVASIGLPVILCDEQLRVVFSSLEAQAFFGLNAASRGQPLDELMDRLPGGEDLSVAARSVLLGGATNELQFRHGFRHYLIRMAAASTGLSLVFTDVTALETATAHALAQHHQQAAIARLSELGGTSQSPAELYDEALAMLSGNIPGCSHGLIIELCGKAGLEVVASRGISDDPLAALRACEPVASCVATIVEQTLAVVELATEDVGERDARAAVWRAAAARGEPIFLTGGVVCPVVEGGALLAVIVAFVRPAHVGTSRYGSFLQSIGHVLAGAVCRQRTRCALALELEASTALAAATGPEDAGERLARTLVPALEAERLEVWEYRVESREWSRSFPRREALLPRETPRRFEAPSTTGRDIALSERLASGCRELVALVPGPARRRALCVLGGRPVSHDVSLVRSLERIARTLAEFLERERIHKLSLEHGAELEAIYANLPVGVSIHERDGSVRRVNGPLQAAGVLGDGATSSLARLYAEQIPEQVARVLGTGDAVYDLELSEQEAHGQRVWLCNIAPIRDANGSSCGAIAVVQDITARKQIETALREADQQKDDFLAMLGHELRNPIAAIRNATELLGRIEQPTPQVARLQSVFERQTAQTARLIDGLLDVARVARGKVELQVERVQIVALVRQAVEDHRQQFQRRSLELSLPDEPLWVEADPARVLQIIDNLISNALKFTSATGRVIIELRAVPRAATLRIADDGVGIEPELLPHIFEPFRQGPASGAHAGGLGLGLALVKGLASKMKFDIEAESAGRGHGSVFFLRFPLVSAPESQPPPSRVDLRSLELLLVEDNEDIADTLSELLVGAGHQVEVAGSAEAALDIVRLRRPHVILCDIGLPGMSGLELAERLRADPALSGVRLVAMTGFGDLSTRRRIEQAGFDRLLLKPVKFEALSRCLSRLSSRPAAVNSR